MQNFKSFNYTDGTIRADPLRTGGVILCRASVCAYVLIELPLIEIYLIFIAISKTYSGRPYEDRSCKRTCVDCPGEAATKRRDCVSNKEAHRTRKWRFS